MGFNSEGLHLAYCSHPVARNRASLRLICTHIIVIIQLLLRLLLSGGST